MNLRTAFDMLTAALPFGSVCATWEGDEDGPYITSIQLRDGNKTVKVDGANVRSMVSIFCE